MNAIQQQQRLLASSVDASLRRFALRTGLSAETDGLLYAWHGIDSWHDADADDADDADADEAALAPDIN